jgi:transcriptional regulator with XRE-family HTH domain
MGRSIYTREHQLLASLLRDVRLRAGLRQVDVAQAMRRSQSFVSDYESGQRRLDLVELRALCEVLGTTLPRLVQRYERALADYQRQRPAKRAGKKAAPRRRGGR